MSALRVGFVSLGCAKNLVDTESMIGLLRAAGHEVTNQQNEADVLVVNTCSFIAAAKQESIAAILEAAQAKVTGNCRALVVAGCLPTRYKEDLLAELPEVDAVIGTADYPRIAEVVDMALAGRRIQVVSDPDAILDWNFPRVLATPGQTAYLKIAEGCNCACAFCSIPLMRGHHRSRPLESILDEGRRLAELGVRELIVISQDTTYYGLDRYGCCRLPELLRELCRIDGVEWVRVHYSYPSRVTPELIEVLATEPRLCKYLDMPLQHGSARVLKLMNRPPRPDHYLDLIARLRADVPDICLRSTFIAGHPGETEADFAELLQFLRAAQLDHVGVFAYSQEEDTPAGQMADQVPAAAGQRRRDKAMAAQRVIALARNRQQVGRTFPVLVAAGGGGHYRGRCYRQSPEIDGAVLFNSGDALRPGDMVPVTLTGVRGYDLVGHTGDQPPVADRQDMDSLDLPDDADLQLRVIHR